MSSTGENLRKILKQNEDQVLLVDVGLWKASIRSRRFLHRKSVETRRSESDCLIRPSSGEMVRKTRRMLANLKKGVFPGKFECRKEQENVFRAPGLTARREEPMLLQTLLEKGRFRALPGAASLKLTSPGARRWDVENFRAIPGAASLKPTGVLRGTIPAGKISAPSQARPH